MSTRDWQRIEALFREAVALPPERRSAFLDEQCGAEPDLRKKLERFLENDARADEGFLRTPPPDPRLDAILAGGGPDELLGRTIGSCRVKKVLARGGMGTVYLADQLKPRREVALKVMHGGLWSRSARRRFEYESQVLARLHHPHIAQVYEAGTATASRAGPRPGAGLEDEPAHALPYFVMELIPGARTITQYAEENGLNTRERLELFVPACEAVQHGHQKGIIHRDLKPANILVDAEGRVKIIDFGVARSVDSDVAITTMHTAVGDLIGTLAYMSPEQCDADPLGVDTRSDVYALGVVLYELVCGRLPYNVSNTSLTAAARIIREEVPQRPGTIKHNLRGDIETILLKALEKDREKRYGSAADLAQDIQRYLNREPIEARPPTAWMRGVRWVSGHPKTATTTGCLFIAGIVTAATFVSIWVANARPYEIVRYRNGVRVTTDDWRLVDEARLLSFGGRSLCRWGGESSAIAFAELAERPPEFGGGKLAVIGYGEHATHRWRGSLCAYDVNDSCGVPVWSQRVETGDILSELRREREYDGDQFTFKSGKFVDVFGGSDHPGSEFIAIFAHTTRSQRVIRIYDLNGTLLYQVWHDGGVRLPYWMSAARLLVFVGDNAFVNWDRRGNLVRDKLNPIVVFALRPEPGQIGDAWLRHEPGGDPGNPAWYNCLYIDQTPATSDNIATPTLIPPPLGRDPGRFVDVNLLVGREIGAGLRWTIDRFGEEVPGSREPTDAYQADRISDNPTLTDPDRFHLGPMPPITSAEGSAEGSLSDATNRTD